MPGHSPDSGVFRSICRLFLDAQIPGPCGKLVGANRCSGVVRVPIQDRGVKGGFLLQLQNCTRSLSVGTRGCAPDVDLLGPVACSSCLLAPADTLATGERRVGSGFRELSNKTGLIAVHSFDVVVEVPSTWKSIPDTAVAVLGRANVGLVAVAVHTVSLSLMTQKTGSGRKLLIAAGSNLASIWPQVGVDMFAYHSGCQERKCGYSYRRDSLIIAFQSRSLVVAALLPLKWAMVKSVRSHECLVQGVAPRRIWVTLAFDRLKVIGWEAHAESVRSVRKT
jgi:hypothetical protein